MHTDQQARQRAETAIASLHQRSTRSMPRNSLQERAAAEKRLRDINKESKGAGETRACHSKDSGAEGGAARPPGSATTRASRCSMSGGRLLNPHAMIAFERTAKRSGHDQEMIRTGAAVVRVETFTFNNSKTRRARKFVRDMAKMMLAPTSRAELRPHR